jgi:hypothetical protein
MLVAGLMWPQNKETIGYLRVKKEKGSLPS